MEEQSILFIHHGTIIGGAPVSLSLQVQGIAERGKLKCRIACNSEIMQKFFSNKGLTSSPWPYPCTFLGKVLIRWSQISNLNGCYQLLKEFILFPISVIQQSIAFKNSQEKIVHLNSAVLFSSAIAAKISGKKIVWHIREASHFPKIAQISIQALADEIICISDIEASRFSHSDPKIHVIYNPVNFSRFDEEQYNAKDERERLGIPRDAKVIVSFGGVVPRKGAKEIVDALEYCEPNTYAIFVGPPLRADQKDAYHKSVKQSCRKVGNSRVKFLGIVENPAPILACADLLVFAGMTPHFPRPVFEAWAMKKPVVVFAMEGISNNVDHMVNGIVVEEISGKSLGIAIKNIISKGELLRSMGSAGYKKACLMVSQDSSSKAVEEVISEIFTIP